ncbi:MAG TPA: hypothetical protein VGM90_36705 [Kofleriaceae bacterium]|jgi:hypothetical protein
MQIKPPGMFSRGKITLGRPAPHINPDSLVFELTNVWKPRGFEVYKSALFGVDVVLKKSGWTGLAIKIKHEAQGTELMFNAFMPSTFVRMMAMGLIPILIVNSTSWKPLIAEFGQYVTASPYFNGGQLPPGSQGQLPPGQFGGPPQGAPPQQQFGGQPQGGPQQAPPCNVCGTKLDWHAAQNRWGCPRCQQLR